MMLPGLDGAIHAVAVSIEFGGGLFVVAGCVRALAGLVIHRASHAGIVHARLIVADAVIAALGFKTAASLLKTIELQTWDAILMFAAISALRTSVKRFLAWEERRLHASLSSGHEGMPSQVAAATVF